MLKGILQSPRLKYHVHTIGINQYLSNNAIYENKFLEKIKKLYKQAGKCDDQQKFKYSNIFLWLLWFLLLTYSPTTVLYLPWHQHKSRNHVLKNHCVCLLTFQMWKKKNANRRVGAAKSKRKSIKYGNTPWVLKKNKKGN